MAKLCEVLLILAVVVSAASAKTDLEQQAEQLIEDFRSIMETGLADVGIPVLEPAVIKELRVSVIVSPFTAKCVASNVSVSGVSDFALTRLAQEDGSNKLAVAVELPDISVTGQYDLDGKVKIGFITAKLRGKGPLEVALKGVKGEATADVLINPDGTLDLNSLSLDSLSYTEVSTNLENVGGGGVIGSTINALINKLVSAFVKSNRVKITELIEAKGKTLINQYLDSINVKQQMVAEPHPVVLALDERSWIVSDETKDILDNIAFSVVTPALSASSLSNQVLKLLEDFRGIMTTGLPRLNIPVLDPAVIHRMPVDVKMGPFDFSAVATEVGTSGVSKFIIHKLEQIEGTNQLSVSIEVPEVDVTGQYEINGKVSIGFLDVNLSGGKGPVTLTMKGFKGTATADMIVNADGTLNLNWLRFDTWHFDAIKAELKNVFMSQYVNPLINKFIPLFLELNRGWINNWGEKVSKEVVNRYLDGINGKTSGVRSSLHTTELVSTPFVISQEAHEILDELATIIAARQKPL